jgi:phage terminase large subunit-like protein
MYFECKVSYSKLKEDGKQKKVNEPYLVNAVSVTDADTKINKELEPYISGKFSVNNIKTATFSEVVAKKSGDRWFKSKIVLISFDEKSGKEKKSNTFILVQANNIKEAYENIDKKMEGTISDYEIKAIQESPIMDVFN